MNNSFVPLNQHKLMVKMVYDADDNLFENPILEVFGNNFLSSLTN